MKARVDARRRDPHLKKGDLVLVSAKIYPGREVNRKQAPKFYGPFLLGDARGPNAFEVLGLPSSMHSTINVSYLKRFEPASDKFPDRPQHPCNLPVVTDDGEPEWEVEAIRDTRTTRRGRMFLVKWVGYTREEWLALPDLANSPTLLVQYFAVRGEEVPRDVREFLSARQQCVD